jgi:hypothetical protein
MAEGVGALDAITIRVIIKLTLFLLSLFFML